MAMLDEKIPVRWQKGFYHITIVFVNDDMHVAELKNAFSKVLATRKATMITLDKLEAFRTQSGREIVINLAPSNPSPELSALINDLRKEATDLGANINPNFFIHVTLGRIDAHDADLNEVKRILSSISLPIITHPIREVEYLYRQNHTSICRWTLT
jgi:2'-5' RNA ligase